MPTRPFLRDRGGAWRVVFEMLSLVSIMIAVPVVLYLDFAVLGTRLTEESITELLHNILLVIIIMAFCAGAIRFAEIRRYLLVLVTFFTCLLIREADAVFDQISHGFWVYPTLAVLILGTIMVARDQGAFLRPMLRHLETREAVFIIIGLASLLIFTRLLGSGSLWAPVMGDAYDPRFKSVLQEGLELFSYALITYGSCLSLFSGFASRDNTH